MGETLYEIKEEYLEALNNLSINEDGEVEGYEELLKLKGDLTEKIENTVLWIKNQKALIEMIESEEDSLKARRETKKRCVERSADFLRSVLIEADMERFESPKARVSFRSSTSVEIVNEEAIPSEFKTVENVTKVDKMAIKKAAKEGVVVPGAELVTRENIQIK